MRPGCAPSITGGYHPRSQRRWRSYTLSATTCALVTLCSIIDLVRRSRRTEEPEMFVVVAVSESRVEAIAVANRWTDASKARDTYIVEDLIISSGVPAV